ncbi:hypothetical protein CkaCkLH20_11335 [Colletotrichum karsti]|uniref:Uncharacterized protein n=1 Tax=Colletotrichum karsti TaxID=1095194 RepID=A0A9P6HY20_9PEZI|nr:uncharacterized protein CkaCkLH20_11335 [Colletotrichum karsti]KAF9871166.1 hypothetical protein CkaCkLH20_11335 [Colletotrichum karsti]
MRTSDKLVMNWTCVHDVMSAGFTVLYCGLSRQDLTRNHAVSLQAWNRQLSMILEITSSIIDTLAHIAETWTSVGKHIRIFKALAGKVVDSLQSTFVVDLGGDAASIAPLRNTGEQGPTGDFSTEIHQAQSWNMPPAFSDNMLNLDNIDWSMIDWDEILPPGESPQWMHNTLGNFDGSGYVADQ